MIHSTVEDLQTQHFPALKRVIAAVNIRYRRQHNLKTVAEEQKKTAKDQDEQQLKSLKERLKFD